MGLLRSLAEGLVVYRGRQEACLNAADCRGRRPLTQAAGLIATACRLYRYCPEETAREAVYPPAFTSKGSSSRFPQHRESRCGTFFKAHKLSNCDVLSREGLPQDRIQGSSADVAVFRPGPTVNFFLLAHRPSEQMVFAPHQVG